MHPEVIKLLPLHREIVAFALRASLPSYFLLKKQKKVTKKIFSF